MSPEAEHYLVRARESLDEARQIAEIDLIKSAARAAYYAAFHAAQAFIFERLVKVAKTHSGVRTEFARLAVEFAQPEPLTRLLAKGYGFKEAGDYSLNDEGQATAAELPALIEGASKFIDVVEQAMIACPGRVPIGNA